MKALILVDIQNDFLPGGALAVPRGDEVLAPACALEGVFRCVAATQDWHPPDHKSFAASHPGKKPGDVILLGGVEQVLWPVHCVQHTRGAEISRVLDPERITRVFPKGMDPDVDSYSGFFDNGRIHATGLDDWLKERGASELYVAGLATDYCVRATALDARKLGWTTSVVEDACRGVELRPGDAARALDELRRSGVRIIDVATAVDEASR